MTGPLNVSSNLVSLGDIENRLRIPLYQRLYVWDGATITTLLNDIHNAFRSHRDSSYFIGAILVREEDGTMEIIDGQQRLTTLWLVGLVCALRPNDSNTANNEMQQPTSPLWGFVASGEDDERARLYFDIRETVDKWCSYAIRTRDLPDDIADSDADDNEDGDRQRFIAAVKVITGWFSNGDKFSRENDRKSFEEYLMEQVKLLLTKLPEAVNPVRTFEAVNDRSVQLEQHEVLKARLLHRLDDKDGEGGKEFWGSVWDACAQMDHYIEHYQSTPDIRLDGGQAKSDSEVKDPRCLFDIIQNPGAGTGDQSGDAGRGNDGKGPSVRSIIPFPVLLLHALRIWVIRNPLFDDRDPHSNVAIDLSEFQERRLLGLFDEIGPHADRRDGDKAGYVRDFFRLLVELRWLFDAWVIKWVDDKADRALRLHTLKAQSNNGDRHARRELEQDDERALSMIQSHLYHTQPARRHLWLTPWLAYLHRRSFPQQGGAGHPVEAVATMDTKELRKTLQWIDDYVFCTDSKSHDPIKSKTFKATELLLAGSNLPCPAICCEPLEWGYSYGSDEDSTRSTPHYWFYKIDLILWLQWWEHRQEGERDCAWVNAVRNRNEDNDSWAWRVTEEAFNNYRFMSRHSVEHVHPQHPEGGQTWSLEGLHGIGNLGLINSSRNSEDSNKSFMEKSARFMDRLVRERTFQSPKLALIYLFGGDRRNNDSAVEWNEEMAIAHKQLINKVVRDWFSGAQSLRE